MRFSSFENMLSYNAEKRADNTAFRFDEAGEIRSVTFSQFYKDVHARKNEIKSLPQGAVGIYRYGTYGWMKDMFASVLAGRQTVLIDPSVDGELLQKVVIYSDVSVLLTDEATEDEASSVKLSTAAIPAADGEGDILFFTSGTTGASKAVVLTSASLCSSAWNGNDKLPCLPTDNLLAVLPFCHVFGFVCSMMWPMSQGACISLGRGFRHLHDDCAYFKPTVISVVPSLLYFLLAKQALNPELRVILVGAGPAEENALKAAKAMGCEVHFGYGLTETSSGVAISTGDDPFAMEVCHDSKITLADDGEILVSCPECMMKGYYKLPDATAAVLSDGVLKTGDLGRFDENGNLHITGKKKDILVLPNGNKIYLPEWESELTRFLGAQELAIAMKDGIVTAIYVDKDGVADKAELDKKLVEFNRTKPFDKQITALCITDKPLPRTATGKIKRWML